MIRHTRLSVLFLSVFALLFFVGGQAAGAERLWLAEEISLQELFGRITDSQISTFSTYLYGSGNKKYFEMGQQGYTAHQIRYEAMMEFKRNLKNKNYDAAKDMLDAMYLSAVGRANVEHADMIETIKEHLFGYRTLGRAPHPQSNESGARK